MDGTKSNFEVEEQVTPFTQELLARAKYSWEVQNIGDLNSPIPGLLQDIEDSLKGDQGGAESNTRRFYAVIVHGEVLGVSEVVVSMAGNTLRSIKQIDTHLCPSIHDKVLFDDNEEAKSKSIRIYLLALLHILKVHEVTRANTVKLYARYPVHLEFFERMVELIQEDEKTKSLDPIIKGRWLEIRGHLGEQK